MNVLVIGGTGLISTGITRQLVDAGHDVTCFTRGQTETDLPASVAFVHGDRDDRDALETARDRVEPDCVIDMVCFDPEQAAAAVEVFDGVDRYVFCSTVDVYHRPLPTNPVTEDAPTDPPVSEYGADKAACERVFAAAYGDAFDVTTIRPWSTYGEGGPVLHTFGGGTYYLDRLREGKPIVVHGDGQSLWGPCHRDDVAAAFVAAIDTPAARGETYHVTSEEVITWNQYHHVVADALGAPEPELVHIPTDVLLAAAPERTQGLRDHFQFSTVFDNAKARRDLEFEYTVSFREGVERTIAHLDENDEIEPWDSEDDDAIVEAWRAARESFLTEVGA
ncbi:NAD-dependent epimerase/dehydratase family protein [Halobaculum marinum]|uniref:NAD-dependent epimerase/dehydratase family protein n=1 Tax=Halobaculum marinum TaxID=3031996 RepID=A0ABD5WZ89_9EURY|nr:NAD-dependent epimerase/dehydratase family protein [Halobaculum sp. DT55]